MYPVCQVERKVKLNLTTSYILYHFNMLETLRITFSTLRYERLKQIKMSGLHGSLPVKLIRWVFDDN